MTAVTYVVDVDQDACAQRLASSPLGRLGVVVDGRPEIYPVNHVYDRQSGCVAFPTNDRTKARAALSWPFVAFEVDDMEPVGGWSVLVVGRAEEVTDPATIARLAGIRNIPWRTGEDVQWIRIVPTKVTGRRICASGRGVTLSIG